ncbi:O-antigen ligase family protein [Patescibacteria group bacterium]|nr:O-antigen ligase family protein [Patescibacteria group bacterium]
MNLNKILTAGLFLSLALGQLQRLPGLPVYAHDLILVLLLLNNFKRLKVYRPVVWFGLASLASLVLAATRLPLDQVLVGSLYLVRFLAYSLLINLKVDRRFLIFFSSAIAFLGLAQYLIVPDTRFLAGLNWDEHYYRLISPLFDPNFTGIILVLGLSLTYAYYRRTWWLYALYLPALLLTYSRSSYLALLAGGLYLALIKKKLRWFIIGGAVLALALLSLPRPGGEGVKLERLVSARQRISNYQLSIDFWRQSPVFGLGFDTLRYYRDNQASHSASGLDSSLLLVLVTTGVVGLAAYVNLLKHLWQKHPLMRLSLVALLTHSLFVNSLFYPWVMVWLFCLVFLDKAKTSGKL